MHITLTEIKRMTDFEIDTKVEKLQDKTKLTSDEEMMLDILIDEQIDRMTR